MLITTPNSDVIYGLAFADLGQTGPLVIEVPPRLQALLDDFWHRPLTGPDIDGVRHLGDVGIPGRGGGGQYLIVSQDHRGEVDEQEYFVFVRGFFSSVESIIIRPLAGEAEPMRFRQVSDVAMNALFPTGAVYFDMLDRFVRSEPDDAVDPYMHGTLATLGITRDKAFAPSARQRELLDPAVRTGWRMAKNIAANFDERDGARWWLAGPYHRAHRTGMMSSVVGMGAKYGNTYKDGDGDLLDLPPDPPAGLFWSVTVHDAETAGGRRGGAGVSVAEQHERPRLQRRRLGHHPHRSAAPGGGEELASDRPGKGVVRHVP